MHKKYLWKKKKKEKNTDSKRSLTVVYKNKTKVMYRIKKTKNASKRQKRPKEFYKKRKQQKKSKKEKKKLVQVKLIQDVE